jgi:dihydroorotase
MSGDDEKITVIAPADFHVHLRQPPFSALIAPHVRQGGFQLAYVMVWSASSIPRELIMNGYDPQAEFKAPGDNHHGGACI